MNWRKLFAPYILERGYDYYCEDAVENLDVSDDIIQANVIGSEKYKVEIFLNNKEVADMYCSCPYASDGRNCKHMAAVLFKWSDSDVDENEKVEMVENNNSFQSENTINTNKKQLVENLVAGSKENDVRSFLSSVLVKNEKLLLRFQNLVNKQEQKDDIRNSIKQIDIITRRYLGRDHFIDFYKAYSFISELEDILSENVQNMIDNADYLSAFEVMNYIFVLVGNVAMDDSGGNISNLAENIYQRWLKLLIKVSPDEKRKMFNWFTSHLNGTVADFLEEYIEQIIIEEFNEKEYDQDKINLIQNMIECAEQNTSDWSRNYNVGKWVVNYLDMLKKKQQPKKR